jgi:hypothetical protein
VGRKVKVGVASVGVGKGDVAGKRAGRSRKRHQSKFVESVVYTVPCL